MSRSTNVVGHTAQADALIAESERIEKIGEVIGMFGEVVWDLHRYRDCNGRTWEEFVQYEPWSSGPVIFLRLSGEDGAIVG